MTSSKDKKLDQFYTNPIIAQKCYDSLASVVKKLKIKNHIFLEPSAGSGAFYNIMPKGSIGVDIDPKCDGVIKADFLKYDLKTNKNVITLGNPPFGKRSKLAIEFFNKCANSSKIVAFIVPVQFRKWGVQKKLKADFELVYDELLPDNAFIFKGKPYEVRCCFQIWVKKDINAYKVNLRIQTSPLIKHEDFEMWQYNNTKEAEKVFDNDFDFAVPRQGYQDYSRRETSKKDCELTKQWILFKAKNKTVLNRLIKLNYEKIAMKNTSIPGFGKADVVEEYMNLYEAQNVSSVGSL
jgi:hypothetical protein